MSDADGPKKETVRITLPPRLKPAESRDTVRINMPARPATNGGPAQLPPRPPPPGSPLRPTPVEEPPSVRPQITNAAPSAPVRPLVFTRPPVPPPSAPAPIVPPAAPSPRAAVSAAPSAEPPTAAPAPPPMPPRPRILPPPPRVIPPPAAAGAGGVAPAIYPGSATYAGPKKETARISILPQPAPPPAVTMAKTQPLLTVPQTNIHTAPVSVVPMTEPVATGSSFDAIPLPICWTIFGISAITLLIQIWNYLAS